MYIEFQKNENKMLDQYCNQYYNYMKKNEILMKMIYIIQFNYSSFILKFSNTLDLMNFILVKNLKPLSYEISLHHKLVCNIMISTSFDFPEVHIVFRSYSKWRFVNDDPEYIV